MTYSPSAQDALGIAGFTFADLHQPGRLRALYNLFCESVRRIEPDLWAQWEAHRLNPTALGPIERSNLIVAVAPHVSRFVTRLFGIGPEAEAMIAATRAYDDLFRFKIDFVRRRALPLLKASTHVVASEADHDLIEDVLGSATDDGSVSWRWPDMAAVCWIAKKRRVRATTPRKPRSPPHSSRSSAGAPRTCTTRVTNTGSCSGSPRSLIPCTSPRSSGLIRVCPKR